VNLSLVVKDNMSVLLGPVLDLEGLVLVDITAVGVDSYASSSGQVSEVTPVLSRCLKSRPSGLVQPVVTGLMLDLSLSQRRQVLKIAVLVVTIADLLPHAGPAVRIAPSISKLDIIQGNQSML